SRRAEPSPGKAESRTPRADREAGSRLRTVRRRNRRCMESGSDSSMGPGLEKVARSVYGYIDPVPGSSPRTWQTYLYYSDCNWDTRGKGCGFGVSLLTFTQQ